MPIDECSHNSPFADQGEKLDSINGSNKTVKSPSVVLGKRTRTDKGDGAAASNKIPWELHLQIQEALELRELVEQNKNEDENGYDVELELCEERLRDLAKSFKKMKQLPRDWKYDPDTAGTFVAILPDNPALKKLPPPPKKRSRCCLAVIDPNQKFPKTRNVPLNEEEKKIWTDFEEFDKNNHGLRGVPMTTRDQYKRPLHCDNPIVSLTGNFAVTAFNEAIEMYVKKDEKNNINDFEIVECKYLKTYKTSYYFYITIEAFEERKFGVYDANVRLNRVDGSLSLLHFVLTDREPHAVMREPTKLKTHPDSWKDCSGINLSGMRLRRNRSICRGYDYRTPWGDICP